MRARGIFEGVDQREIRYRDFVAKAPLFYQRVSAFSGVFLADAEAARALMPTPDHHPVTTPRGHAVAAIHFFEYAQCDIGPYNEVSLAIAVRHGATSGLDAARLLGSAATGTYEGYVVTLPVTTPIALYGGLDLFNYPKYLADIRFEEEKETRTCTVRDRDSGELIVKAQVRKRATNVLLRRALARSLQTFVSYPVKDGRTLRAEMRIQCEEPPSVSFRNGDLRLELGAHEHADVFRRLRLSDPMQMMYAPRCQAILHVPSENPRRS